MFSGIIEATQSIVKVNTFSQRVQLRMGRPEIFNDLKAGDSIAVNGVCLTLEEFSQQEMQFSLGSETIKILNWSQTSQDWLSKPVNLERSLKFGDRIHGHLVTGHVEGIGRVLASRADGESWLLDVLVPKASERFLWSKGSITLQGVSLTVNELTKTPEGLQASVCLIPETIQRTNLAQLSVGQSLSIESDYFAKTINQMTGEHLEQRVLTRAVDRGNPQ